MARLIPPEPIQGSQLRKNLTEIIENKIDNAILVQQTVFKKYDNLIVLGDNNIIVVLFCDKITYDEKTDKCNVDGHDFDDVSKSFCSSLNEFCPRINFFLVSKNPLIFLNAKNDERNKKTLLRNNVSVYASYNKYEDMDKIPDRIRAMLLNDSTNVDVKSVLDVIAKGQTPGYELSGEQKAWRLKKYGGFIPEPIPIPEEEVSEDLEMQALFNQVASDVAENPNVIYSENKLKQIPDRNIPFVSTMVPNNQFMIYLRRVLEHMGFGAADNEVKVSGFEILLEDVLNAGYMFPVIVVATMYQWSPVVAGRSGKGGFTAHIKRDLKCAIGYKITGLELSSSLLFVIPMINVLNSCLTIEKDEYTHADKKVWILDPLLSYFANFLYTYNLDLAPLDNLEFMVDHRWRK